MPARPETGRARRWRRFAFGLGVAGLIGLAIAGWWLGSTDPAPPPAGSQPRAEEPAPEVALRPAPEPPPVAAAPPPPPARLPRDRSTLAPEIQRFLASREYPPDSGRLGAGAVDLLFPNRRFEREKPVPGSRESGPPDTFLWTADRLYYSGGDRVQVRFAARRDDAPAPLRELQATAQAENAAGASGSRLEIPMQPLGDDFVGTLPLEGELWSHHGPIALVAHYQLEGGRPQEELIRVFTTPESRVPGRFTGEFTDRAEAGSLVIDVGLEVVEPGFFRIDANLRDAAGQPVAFAHWKGELLAGSGSVPLTFFGKVLVDAGRPGPYQLTELRGYRFLDGRYPDRERMRDHEGSFASQPYPLAHFSDAPHESEHLARMVGLLEADLEAGLSVDLPPEAGATDPPPAPAGPDGSSDPTTP